MAEQGTPKKIGKCTPLSLTKALQKAVPRAQKQRRLQYLQKLFAQENINKNPEDVSLVDFLQLHPKAAKDLQQKFNVRCVVVQKRSHRNRRDIRFLYDGSRAILQDDNGPLHYFLLDKNNRLKQHTINNPCGIPPLTGANKKKRRTQNQAPLWQLLGHSEHPPEATQDPQTTMELQTFLNKHTPPHARVRVHFVTVPTKEKTTEWYATPIDDSAPLLKTVHILAWTQDNYRLVYSKDSDLSWKRALKRGEKTKLQFASYQERLAQIKEKKLKQPDPCQVNCASSINLSHSGLNLAYNLGLIATTQDLSVTSSSLVQTHSSLYMFLDEKHHLRHITYCDKEETFSTQVTCFEDKDNETLNAYELGLEEGRRVKATDTMLAFWQRVMDRRQHWIKQRQQLLKSLTDCLDQILSQTKKSVISPFSRCKANLKKIIFHQPVYMYSDQDAHLHAIKYYLADFVYKTMKRPKGVTIRAQSDSTLTMLCIPGLTIMNLHTYFDTKSDADFFKLQECNPSATLVSHATKDLMRQPFPAQQHKSMAMHCKQTGKQCAQHILHYWSQFGQFLLAQFFFEVHGLINLSSASYLGFQCIWTAYAKQAGPMAQALEKCKPYHEYLLRQNSKGGFMFSIEDTLDQGDALWPAKENNTNRAQSIAEVDLVSAYGYAASHTHMPSGFCTGFQKADGKKMMKLDARARHKSFEFRAVYQKLHNLIHYDKLAIRSVYSNFSPLGVFCLGSYPIDLVVVTEEGRLILYQMDGQWTHGCPACANQPLYFANGQSWQEVREKTNQRDKDIMAWMMAINDATSWDPPMVQYKIVYDCHSAGYQPEALDYKFWHQPELAELVKGYKVTERLGNSPSLKKLQMVLAEASQATGTQHTFIAKATIHISNQNQEAKEGPLVAYQEREGKYTKQTLAYSGTVVLTRDYYEWLQTSFDQILMENIDWVLFYKTEPIFNQLYNNLTTLRSTTTDPVLVCFIKRMINLSCGFFGAHTSEQNKSTYRLVDRSPADYLFFRHQINLDHTMDLGEKSYVVLETKLWPKISTHQKPSTSAIPMFLSIVEYGKLRLVQILHFIQQHVDPSKFRLLYSNIDNLVFALADADTLEEAIRPQLAHRFQAQKDRFFVAHPTHKTPGMAALEWIRNYSSGWKFISIRTQHYCLVVSQPECQGNLHKTSGWNKLSSQEAYNLSKQMLSGNSVQLMQTRRTDKKSNMDTHQVEFLYNPK